MARNRVGIRGFLFKVVSMAKPKERKYAKKSFESTGASNDTSANIYMTMLLSKAWKSLSKNQQVLYLYCKAQYYAEKKKPKPLYRELTEQEQQQCFTMNKSKWQSLYGIYKSDNGQFNKDMKALISFGFVELVQDGKSSFSKSIYMLSDKWQLV